MQSITPQSDSNVAGQQLPDGYNLGTPGASGTVHSAVATRATNHAAGSSPMVKRSCMIDGIAVSPAMLQALRSMQPSALAALAHSGVSNTANASTIQPQKHPSGEVADGIPQLGQDLSPQIIRSPRRSKRQRVPHNAALLSDQSDPAENRACNVDLIDEGHGSIAASSRDDASSQSDEDDAQMAQLINLQRMVDQLTSLATENSARICGFNRNIESLLRTKDVLISQVDTLSLQLQQQEVQIEELQSNIHQMTLQNSANSANSANSDILQHASSSSSCFSL